MRRFYSFVQEGPQQSSKEWYNKCSADIVYLYLRNLQANDSGAEI